MPKHTKPLILRCWLGALMIDFDTRRLAFQRRHGLAGGFVWQLVKQIHVIGFKNTHSALKSTTQSMMPEIQCMSIVLDKRTPIVVEWRVVQHCFELLRFIAERKHIEKLREPIRLIDLLSAGW